MAKPALYCISEDPKIETFVPSISPCTIDLVREAAVLAFTEKGLPPYFLPPNCPRIVMYPLPSSNGKDLNRLMGSSHADMIIAVEGKWLRKIQQTTLYCYEVSTESFSPLDGSMHVHISHQNVKPVSVRPIYNLLEEIVTRNIEIRFLPRLEKLINAVIHSSIGYSLIQIQHVQYIRNGNPYQGSTGFGYPRPFRADERTGISDNGD